MAIKGDFKKLQGFYHRVVKLKKAGPKIGKAVMPRLTELVAQEFASSRGPYGESWKPLKSGGRPFAGSSAEKRVRIRLINGGKTVRTTVQYPMHFHQDGTHSGGRKAQRKLRKKLRLEGFKGRALKQEMSARQEARTERLPARPIIPEEAKGVPAPWRAAIVEAAKPIMFEAGAKLKGGR